MRPLVTIDQSLDAFDSCHYNNRAGEWSRADASEIDGQAERPNERERMSEMFLLRLRLPERILDRIG